jgi:F-box and leucine-rich repeat protein GRR1
MNSSDVCSFSTFLNNINTLTIENCVNFDDDCLVDIALSTNKLTKIRLISSNKLTSNGYFEFFQNNENLKELTIIQADNFSNETLIDISELCKNLEVLELIDLPNISDDGLVVYKEGFWKLKKLRIDNCENVNREKNGTKIKNNSTYTYY